MSVSLAPSTRGLFLFFSFIWVYIMCLEIAGIQYLDQSTSKVIGQSIMIMLSGINATIWLYGAYIPHFLELHHGFRIFMLIIHAAYLLLWIVSQSWLDDEAKPGFSFATMNNWAKVHVVSMVALVVPICLYLLYQIFYHQQQEVILQQISEGKIDQLTAYKQQQLTAAQQKLESQQQAIQALQQQKTAEFKQLQQKQSEVQQQLTQLKNAQDASKSVSRTLSPPMSPSSSITTTSRNPFDEFDEKSDVPLNSYYDKL